MPQVVIENPVINSPFEEPGRHFRFSEDGITDEIVEKRRVSSYFIPIPAAKKKGKKQLVLDTEWTADRIEENRFINQVRERVALWRQGGCQGVTATTRFLLEYWRNPDREKPLFFCQIEALETAIYASECGRKRDRPAKVASDRNLWVPAVNNHGGFGRWGFLEISDPWDAEGTVQTALVSRSHVAT